MSVINLYVASNGTWPEMGACLTRLRELCPDAVQLVCSVPVEVSPPGTPWTSATTIWMWNAARQWNHLLRLAPITEPNASVALVWLRNGTLPAELDLWAKSLGTPNHSLILHETQAGLLILAAPPMLQSGPTSLWAGINETSGNSNLREFFMLHAQQSGVPVTDHTDARLIQPLRYVAGDTPLLTACLISKNGARYLAECLESLAGAVDEVALVVDAATTDQTVEIAHRYGAVIRERAWDGNFSNARNAALSMARGSWTLMIDSDEVLAPGAAAELRRTLAGLKKSYVSLPIFSYNGEYESGGGVSEILRIAPRQPGIAYTGRIHEQLQGPRMPKQTLPNTLYHYGYLGETMVTKLARNAEYLEKEWNQNPRDPRLSWYMAGTKAFHGDLPTALQILEGITSGATTWHAMVNFMRASLLLSMDRVAEALPLIQETLKRWSFPPAHVLLGDAHLAQGQFVDARSAYQAALTAQFDPRLREQAANFNEDVKAQAYAGLSKVARLRKLSAEAEEMAREAIRLAPSFPAAQLALVDVLTDSGRLQDALDHLALARPRANHAAIRQIATTTARICIATGSPTLAAAALQDPRLPVADDRELLELRARVAELESDWAAALALWNRSIALAPSPFTYAHRAACAIRLGDFVGAHGDLEQALEGGRARHPFALVAMALLADVTGNAQEALEYLLEAYDQGLSDADVLLLLSQTALRAGDLATAGAAAEAILQVNPNHHEANQIARG